MDRDDLSYIIRQTEEYKQVCETCRDEILTYPTISGRTSFTDKEVESITLRLILRELHEAQDYRDRAQSDIFSDKVMYKIVKAQRDEAEKGLAKILGLVLKTLRTRCVSNPECRTNLMQIREIAGEFVSPEQLDNISKEQRS